jgi:hypothetical protein
MRSLSLAGLVVGVSASLAAGEATWTFKNITSRTYTDEVFRLPVKVPDGDVLALEDGKELPSVVDTVEGERRIYVRATIAPGETRRYEVKSGKRTPGAAAVKVIPDGDVIVLDNGVFALKVPARAQAEAPGPVQAVRLDGKWIGKGRWDTDLKFKSLKTTVVDDGRVMGKVRLRYEFEGLAGLNDDIPAYEIGRAHV